jgi:hypothetical protein
MTRYQLKYEVFAGGLTLNVRLLGSGCTYRSRTTGRAGILESKPQPTACGSAVCSYTHDRYATLSIVRCSKHDVFLRNRVLFKTAH